MLSIHINLSAGAQNITGADQQKLFVQGYNLEALKHTRKHHVTVIISRASQALFV